MLILDLIASSKSSWLTIPCLTRIPTIAKISPNSGVTGASYNKFNYPETYKSEVQITKFERNFRKPNQRLVEGGVYGPPANRCEYTLRNAYPVNISSIPLSYDQSSLLRTTVTFNYDVYNFNPRPK